MDMCILSVRSIGKALENDFVLSPHRSIRKWWAGLPANRQELLKQALWRHRWHLAAGGAVLLVALSMFIFTHLDESPVTGRTRLLVFSRDNFLDLANVTSEGVRLDRRGGPD